MERTGVVGPIERGGIGSSQQTHLGGTSMLNVYLRIRNYIEDLLHNEEGQTLTEYALILVLIAIAAILAMTFLGTQISTIFSSIGNKLTPAT